WNSDPRPSQEHYCMGTVNFWDIANYRKLQESPGHHPAAFRTHCIPHHENMLLGKCCQGEKIFLADEQDISIVICNILSLVKQFEAKEKSVSIRNLDYFSKLSRVRTRGHLIDIVKPFDAVPPVYRSPSPTLQPARDRLEELVSHVKPTVRFNPI
ncbi:hypothetical protein HZB03_00610, partial [Candidatus Woesearchaeota archaeon]|nr:hypothetical protein [Candidatus Woesearchaeota archaeon]